MIFAATAGPLVRDSQLRGPPLRQQLHCHCGLDLAASQRCRTAGATRAFVLITGKQFEGTYVLQGKEEKSHFSKNLKAIVMEENVSRMAKHGLGR